MTRLSDGSKNYLNFKILMIVKDIFDIFSCNVTTKEILDFHWSY